MLYIDVDFLYSKSITSTTRKALLDTAELMMEMVFNIPLDWINPKSEEWLPSAEHEQILYRKNEGHLSFIRLSLH